jgi:hypothetical protein
MGFISLSELVRNIASVKACSYRTYLLAIL